MNRAQTIVNYEIDSAQLARTKQLSKQKLPTPEQTGAILFLRSRCLSLSEISKHLNIASTSVTLERAFWPEAFTQDGVSEEINRMAQLEQSGTDWHAMYAKNPYGRKRIK
jgi:hypothetical protein